jgi:hypothetical protein
MIIFNSIRIDACNDAIFAILKRKVRIGEGGSNFELTFGKHETIG